MRATYKIEVLIIAVLINKVTCIVRIQADPLRLTIRPMCRGSLSTGIPEEDYVI